MKTERFSYKGVEIEFTPTKSGDIMINATQMCSLFGKEITHFLGMQGTELFIEAMLERAAFVESEVGVVGTTKSEYQYHARAIFAGIKTREDIVSVSRKHGTKIHRLLALKLASWLDPHFEVWVYETIDSLFFSEIRLQRDLAFKRQNGMAAKKRIDEAAKKRIDEEIMAAFPQYADYLNADRDIKEANTGIRKSQNRMLKQFELEFEEMQNQSK